jgi:hypothetical protein
VMVVMRRHCMGVVDDGGGSGRPVLFVDLGIIRHCKL